MNQMLMSQMQNLATMVQGGGGGGGSGYGQYLMLVYVSSEWKRLKLIKTSNFISVEKRSIA